jgi:cytochrome P450
LEDITVRVEYRKEGGGSEMKEVSMSEAINEVFEQTMMTVGTRMPNPIWRALYSFTGENYAFTAMEKLSNENCAKLRATIRDYVRKRTSGERKSQVGDQSDMLSLFLQSPDIFTEDVIIDELIDFLIAGSQSTQFTTQTILAHFATNKASLERVRAEFESTVVEAGSSKDKPVKEMLKHDLTLEACSDLTYLGYVIQESLRVNPTAPATSPAHFEKDVKVGNLHIKAYDPFMINHSQLHLSALYWKEPERFNPNRFDDSHPDSRCPDGSKRPQFCWMPFNGGKRVCFGKTFVEAVLRMVGTMFSQTFDFELVNSDKYDANNLP